MPGDPQSPGEDDSGSEIRDAIVFGAQDTRGNVERAMPAIRDLEISPM